MSTVLRVVAAALLREGRCFVAQRPPEKAFGLLWEFPGGKLEPGESAEYGLARELREELGWDVRIGESLGASETPLADGRTLRLELFVAAAPDHEPVLIEHVAARWCSAEELETLDWAAPDVPLVGYVARVLGARG